MKNRFIQTHTKGAALLIFVLFFMFASAGITYMFGKGIYSDMLSYRLLHQSKLALFAAESGIEDAVGRYILGASVDSTETLQVLNDGAATTTSAFTAGNSILLVEATGGSGDVVRKSTLSLSIGSGAAFNFGIQTGNGGFEMTNSAKVIGNVFSNGDIEGGGSSVVEGDVIAAGSGGVVDGIHATGSVRADIIQNSTIDMDSYYYTSFINNSYSGAVNGPNWPVEATTSLPIPDSVIDAHKASVTAAIGAGVGTLIAATDPECGGGQYVINSDTTLTGIYKIECDVLFDKNNTDVSLTDTLWVSGDFEVKNAKVIADPATSTDSILIIVDNEADRTTSSRVILSGAEFEAPSSPKAYIVIVSMNEDAENGGTETAIDIGNSTGSGNYDEFVAYAGHGEVVLGNQIHLKEVTGYVIDMGNNSTVEYETGLANLNFTSGPGGGFELGSWEEVF